ncbi:uncharacterized protein BDZ99DRAFT_515507 [Mytilinidion resinicola]|uniref:F-box domain-containing protein n=1 Tax=Mytilinidion resinicola TaxID=574789 RepID=A0A6A6Z0W0_9PEZI|nr:uncharacterized protein BDZ99DRAFT_515507 [Mytilinidion resinicola]KAF2814731.1 hypothetical protein BDZ99DRAFT_515507 [Mytilinidion resinicola]
MSTRSPNQRGLEQLPRELWLEILSWLTCERDAVLEVNERDGMDFQRRIPKAMTVLKATKADLRNLCLTCRFLNFNTQPALYEFFDQVVKEPRSLPLFLRTLLRQPKLALHVRRVDAHFLVSDRARFYGRRLPREDGPLFTSALNRHRFMGDKTRKQFQDLFRVGSTMGDTLAVLLLWHTPNLRELNIEHEDGPGYAMLEELILKTLLYPVSSLPFSKLQKLKIWFSSPHEFSRASPWLLLPSLQSLDVRGTYASTCNPALQDLKNLRWRVDSIRSLNNLATFTSSVTSLVIHCDKMILDALYDILFYCKALKSFELYWSPFHPKNPTDFNLHETLKALLCRKDSLSKLRLDIGPRLEGAGRYFVRGTESKLQEREKNVPSAVSFKAFEQLTHLHVPGPALHEWLTVYRDDVLPPTLEILKLPTFEISTRDEIDDLVNELVLKGLGQCPLLKMITFGLNGEDMRGIRGTLSIRFNEGGFSVEARNASGDLVEVDDLALVVD